MKILDATAVIAFLDEMKCVDGIIKLSKHQDAIIPEGVADEIIKSPGREILQELISDHIVKIIYVDQLKVKQILNKYNQLHRGECEVIVFAQTCNNIKDMCIVSDDKKAKKIFNSLPFKRTSELLEIMNIKNIINNSEYKLKNKILDRSTFHSKN